MSHVSTFTNWHKLASLAEVSTGRVVLGGNLTLPEGPTSQTESVEDRHLSFKFSHTLGKDEDALLSTTRNCSAELGDLSVTDFEAIFLLYIPTTYVNHSAVKLAFIQTLTS